ncbi:MAG: hypothetical protein AB7O65_03630, partial [Candidatus Korobacteraceae bacterium]
MSSTWIGYPHTPTHNASALSSTSAASASVRETVKGNRRRCSSARKPSRNRRETSRAAHHAELVLHPLVLNSSRPRGLKARLVDASEGGLRVVLSRSIEVSSVVRCQFAIAGLSASVPTLLQV